MIHLPGRYMAMAGGLADCRHVAELHHAIGVRAGRVDGAPWPLPWPPSLVSRKNTRARHGLVIAAGWGTTIPAFGILPSNVVNMAFVGASESIFGIGFTYFGYTFLNFPVLGVLGVLVVILLVTLLFGAKPQPRDAETTLSAWSGGERRLMGIMLIALAFWMTDSLHGISPAWVALAAALLCITPKIGMLPASCDELGHQLRILAVRRRGDCSWGHRQ